MRRLENIGVQLFFKLNIQNPSKINSNMVKKRMAAPVFCLYRILTYKSALESNGKIAVYIFF